MAAICPSTNGADRPSASRRARSSPCQHFVRFDGLRARTDHRRAHVVELRFFGGLSVEETADVLQVSADRHARLAARPRLVDPRALTGGLSRYGCESPLRCSSARARRTLGTSSCLVARELEERPSLRRIGNTTVHGLVNRTRFVGEQLE